LFSYFNPLMQYGVEKLSRQAKDAGIDGVLITDMTPEESGEVSATLKKNDVDMIFLVAPTTTDERLKQISEHASGFIYAVSRAGVTGVRDALSAEAEKLVRRTRRFSDLPIAVGFGISTAAQVSETWSYADAAVVGSALVAEIERLRDDSELVRKVTDFARGLLPNESTRK
jgi:tryptophan synthase alpha chain